MDTITQMAFGAVVGQAGWRQRFGRTALVAGAIAGLVPDLDVFIQTGDPFAGWLYHRNISHSIIGAPILGLLTGFGFWFYFSQKYKRGRKDLIELAARESLTAWLWLGVLAVTTHIWLDLLTPYGTQLLAPFSNTRFSLNVMPVIDFTYTFILIIAIIAGVFLKVPAKIAQAVAGVAIIVSIIWQVFAWDINEKAQSKAKLDFSTTTAEIHSYPTLLTPFLRRINVETANHIYIGYWDFGDEKINWRAYKKQYHPYIENMKQSRGYKILFWFAKEQVFWRVNTLENGNVRVEAHDLRYLSNLPKEPHNKRLQGLWGLRQEFDKTGTPATSLERWTQRPSTDRILGILFDR